MRTAQMPKLIALDTLSPGLQAQVMFEWRQRVGHPHYLLTQHEASLFYDVPYGCLRTFIQRGKLVPLSGEQKERRLAHTELCRFITHYYRPRRKRPPMAQPNHVTL